MNFEFIENSPSEAENLREVYKELFGLIPPDVLLEELLKMQYIEVEHCGIYDPKGMLARYYWSKLPDFVSEGL